jgi:hypothetical protein
MSWPGDRDAATLGDMSETTDAAETTEKPAKPAPTPTWDHDPLVVVSSARVFPFPLELLRKAHDDEALQRWHGPNARAADRNERLITLHAGATFLGATTSAWALRAVTEASRAPTAPPQAHQLRFIVPDTTSRDVLLGREFVSRESGHVDPLKVQAALQRVLDYLKHQRTFGDHFVPEPGFDNPRIIVLRISELLSQGGRHGGAAFSLLGRQIPYCKSAEHLGALHDYAARSGPRGWGIVEKCRDRANFFPKASLGST